MSEPAVSLWRHGDFMKLWVGESISLLGSQITTLALPLTAVILLKATPDQMGVLEAAQFLPFLLIGLFAGVWVDRNRRKNILMIGDIGRAILLTTIPIAFLLSRLGMGQLYVVGFLVGILTVFFDVAYQSYLPALVSRLNLSEGNSKLEISRSTAQVAGPGLAGILIKLLSAPLAIFLDALSFIASALFLAFIKTQEPPPIPKSEQRHILREIWEGLQVILSNPILRSIALCTATSNLFGSIIMAILLLYAVNQLGIDAGGLGVIFSVASIGGIIGAMLAQPAVKRLGLGWAIIAGIAVESVGSLFIPLASGSLLVAAPILIAAQFLLVLGSTAYNINQVSLRQTITPDRLLGRMNASMRFIVWGTIPIGSLIGGALGGAIGLRPTLVVGALGGLLAILPVYLSPVRALREQPAPVTA